MISKEKKNTLHIASCSFGKDSLATILLALEHGEPLDEAVYCEVMFDKRTSGEVPEHRAFIYETAIPRLERLGIPVRVLRSDKTYLDLFAGVITRGPKKGLRRGFPLCGHCYVQRDCKLRPIRLYNRTLTPDTVQYVGIASDEPVRLHRLQGDQVSLLENITTPKRMQSSSAKRQGCFLQSMRSQTVAVAGSARMPSGRSCGTFMTTIRSCGRKCWSCRQCQERCLRNSTARRAFPTSMRHSEKKMPCAKKRHKKGKGDENHQQSKI